MVPHSLGRSWSSSHNHHYLTTITMKTYQIAVIGSAGAEEYSAGGFDFAVLYEVSRELGSLLARRGCRVVTGGKSGIME